MANNNSGRDKNEKDLICSFCGKHQDEVERMIIGTTCCRTAPSTLAPRGHAEAKMPPMSVPQMVWTSTS